LVEKFGFGGLGRDFGIVVRKIRLRSESIVCVFDFVDDLKIGFGFARSAGGFSMVKFNSMRANSFLEIVLKSGKLGGNSGLETGGFDWEFFEVFGGEGFVPQGFVGEFLLISLYLE
jgi:hypothetical protein